MVKKMLHVTLANALSSLRNASRAGIGEVEIKPSSKLIEGVLRLFKDKNYIKDFEMIKDGRGGIFKVILAGNLNECGVIRPRYPINHTEFERWEARYLPARDFGMLVLTTSKGLMDQSKAKEIGIGGKLLAFVY